MNKIQSLINELCPDGVEFKKLGEVCKIITAPKKLNKETYQARGLYPIIDQGQKFIIGYTDDEDSLIQQDEYVIFGDHTREVKFINFQFAQGADGVKILKAKWNILPKFLYYLICNTEIPSRGYNRHWTIAKDIQIPLPPLPIQQEIVNILDKFTQLEAELEARRKQYEHYRSKLLTFSGLNGNSGGCKWLIMSEMANFIYGFTDKAKDVGNVRFIRITDINENGKLREEEKKYLDLNDENRKYLLQKGDILMARTGATYGKTMIFNGDENAVYASFLIKIDLNKAIINPSYYWHFAQSNFYWEQANKLVSSGAQPQFNANVLKLIQIPIPPLEEQNRIVAILDKFDSLANDISVGLPAEINMRRQQYEYYRNKLLTF